MKDGRSYRLLDGLSRRPRRWGRSPGAAVERLHGRGRKRGHPCQELGNSEGRGRCLLLPATPSVVCFAAASFWRSAPPRRRAAPSLGHARDADRRARRSAARLHARTGEHASRAAMAPTVEAGRRHISRRGSRQSGEGKWEMRARVSFQLFCSVQDRAQPLICIERLPSSSTYAHTYP
jgi:hypothetical protein